MNINVTLFWQMVFFAIFVWFSYKYVWAPILTAINARKATIADGLAAADKGQQAEEEGRKAAEEVVNEAKAQASEIISKAEKTGSEIVEDAKAKAVSEGNRITTAAQDEIQTEMNKARESLRGQVGELAVQGARQILGREVDAKAHSDLLDKLASKL